MAQPLADPSIFIQVSGLVLNGCKNVTNSAAKMFMNPANHNKTVAHFARFVQKVEAIIPKGPDDAISRQALFCALEDYKSFHELFEQCPENNPNPLSELGGVEDPVQLKEIFMEAISDNYSKLLWNNMVLMIAINVGLCVYAYKMTTEIDLSNDAKDAAQKIFKKCEHKINEAAMILEKNQIERYELAQEKLENAQDLLNSQIHSLTIRAKQAKINTITGGALSAISVGLTGITALTTSKLFGIESIKGLFYSYCGFTAFTAGSTACLAYATKLSAKQWSDLKRFTEELKRLNELVEPKMKIIEKRIKSIKGG